MPIDHIIYAEPDLDIAVAHIEKRFGGSGRRGVGSTWAKGPTTSCWHSALGHISTSLLLILSNRSCPAPCPYGIDGVTHGSLVGWALGCDDIHAALARARSQGFDPCDAIDGQRVGPTGTTSNRPAKWSSTAQRSSTGEKFPVATTRFVVHS